VRDARQRFLPAIIFLAALAAVIGLWKDYVTAPTLVGQVESVPANVTCYKPGMLAQLTATRFQEVKAGDILGQVVITDPKILASSLAVIQAEIEVLRVGMMPIAAEQRMAMDYSKLRLDWMRQRAELAMERVKLQLAESDLQRKQELFKDKIISVRAIEEAQATKERLKSQVEELAILVNEQASNFDTLQLTNSNEITKINDQYLRASIAAQEAKLRQTEAELSPIVLQAPIDGTVSVVFHRSGEAVTAGEPILSVAPSSSTRIVGYLRPPVKDGPIVGIQVEVRTRGPHREVGRARIFEVGTQFETPTAALQAPVKMAAIDLGLPIGITIPPNLRIRPGELVDLTLHYKASN
jgi:membrane fusion protein